MRRTTENHNNTKGFSSILVFFLVGVILLGIGAIVYFSVSRSGDMSYGGVSNTDKATPSAGASATVSTPMPTISSDTSQSTIDKEIDQTVIDSVDSEFESLSTSVKDL